MRRAQEFVLCATASRWAVKLLASTEKLQFYLHRTVTETGYAAWHFLPSVFLRLPVHTSYCRKVHNVLCESHWLYVVARAMPTMFLVQPPPLLLPRAIDRNDP